MNIPMVDPAGEYRELKAEIDGKLAPRGLSLRFLRSMP